jgi:microsomal dipeptidase-like Zn-dependent dipeptidase
MGHGKSPKAVGAKASGKKGHYVGFEKLVQRIMAKGKSREDAEAIAASIGRRKYGAAKFQAAAAHGHKLSNEAGDSIDLAVPDHLRNHPGFKKLVKRIKTKGKSQEEAEDIAMKLAKNWGKGKKEAMA